MAEHLVRATRTQKCARRLTGVKKCVIVYGMAKDDRPRIGRQLRRAMERARLDQNQVADALGVSRGAVNSWINDRAYPMNSLAALEELLGVSFDRETSAAPASDASLEDKVDRLQRELAELWRIVGDRDPKGNEDNGGRRAV